MANISVKGHLVIVRTVKNTDTQTYMYRTDCNTWTNKLVNDECDTVHSTDITVSVSRYKSLVHVALTELDRIRTLSSSSKLVKKG